MASTSPAEPQSLARERAVASRLRSMLLRQREKLQAYLHLLERQERSILEEDMAGLQTHVEMERSILEEIHSLRRVIEPLEELYRGCAREAGARGEAEARADAQAIDGLKGSLRRLRDQVTARNRANCRLLEERMEGLRQRIRGLHRPRSASSPFSRIGNPALVDISL